MKKIKLLCIKNVFDEWLGKNICTKGKYYNAEIINSDVNIHTDTIQHCYNSASFILEHFLRTDIKQIKSRDRHQAFYNQEYIGTLSAISEDSRLIKNIDVITKKGTIVFEPHDFTVSEEWLEKNAGKLVKVRYQNYTSIELLTE